MKNSQENFRCCGNSLVNTNKNTGNVIMVSVLMKNDFVIMNMIVLINQMKIAQNQVYLNEISGRNYINEIYI